MKNATKYAKKVGALLRRLKSKGKIGSLEAGEPIETLVRAFLTWETSTRQSDLAMERVTRYVVDFNDLRVTGIEELMSVIGERYSQCEERVIRLRRVLQDIFEREHAVRLDRLTGMNKREARSYIESLDGIVPFVSASLILLCFEGHAIPVDEHLAARLKRDGIVDEKSSLKVIEAFLERHIKASDAIEAYYLFRYYVGKSGGPKVIASKVPIVDVVTEDTERKIAMLKARPTRAAGREKVSRKTEKTDAEKKKAATEKVTKKKVTKASTKKTTKKTAKSAAKKITKKTAKSAAKKITKKVTKSAAKKITKKVAKSAGKKITKKAAKSTAKKTVKRKVKISTSSKKKSVTRKSTSKKKISKKKAGVSKKKKVSRKK